MRKVLGRLCLALALATVSTVAAVAAAADPIADAVGNTNRTSEERLRDEFRHPIQTLRFLGVEPDMKIAEIWPGGGWYTQILAPLVAEKGKLYAAHFYVDENSNSFFKNSRKGFEDKVKTYAPFKDVEITSFNQADANLAIAPADSLDAVLTFRNVHNWYMRGDDQGVTNAFEVFHKALKPGGMLGVIEHRMPENFDMREKKNSGYVKQSYVIDMAQRAGFELVATSEINANANDTADHPSGVWTLAPRYRLGDKDKAKYRAIGESDRMTLKFIKR
jgi:predicted methyltransferase